MDNDKDYVLHVTNEKKEVFDIEVVDIVFNDITKKKYIIYTLGEIDKDNNQKIYASVLEDFSNTYNLKPITDEGEWKYIQAKIKEIFE